MRKITTPYKINKSNGRANVLSIFAAIVVAVIGFVMFQPFFWIVIVYGVNFHHISFLGFLMIMGFILGAPMFLFGLINVCIGERSVGSASTADIDLGRIRYTVENDRMNRK